jgi:hypothetical protein
MIVRALLLLLGLFHIANGLTMLVAPMAWYDAVPGVTATGPFNHHFILDIGMAFLASGGLLALGARNTASAASFAIAGATWPILHALIHISGWFMDGFPSQANVAVSEVVGVVTFAALGGVLAWLRLQGES